MKISNNQKKDMNTFNSENSEASAWLKALCDNLQYRLDHQKDSESAAVVFSQLGKKHGCKDH